MLEVFLKQDSPLRKASNEILKSKVSLLPIEEKILSCIIDTSRTIEEIGREIKISQIELIEYISIMELEGKIRVVAGGLLEKISI